MRILLTGSNGFIGRRIAADATARGWQVVGLGRKATPSTEVAEYVSHDLRVPLTADIEVDAVIHAAALASPWASPDDYQRDNVEGTRHVREWAETHGRPRIAYVSSSSVLYRDADQLDLTEGSPTPPDGGQINAYSRTKLQGERLIRAYEGEWVILRPRAVFGVGDTVLLPRVVAAARKGVLPRFVRRDGHVVRCDLTPVASVSHYVLEAVARGATGVLNVTNGEAVELNGFVDDVLARLGIVARRPRVPVGLAMALAGAAERVSAAVAHYAEPPITRFGVSMFARSKTFDASALHAALGPAPVSIADTVTALVEEWRVG
ncbi:MAG TPA: NAD(P)-dependent oxidoreductase [Pengzhenrongella sp.]|jgi:nucleoside-diphosphate-sugar epimerase